ncbi:MAG: DNA-directed RNA polymerase, subunit E'' [Candidatus Thermoplasmatota archaeon]|jgi:DNA-directed RNA polymerase subunit E"|nr:DNA-directed RNA polymerase, subunit E'' [Candidatus Thermoplasmatota archaeon]MCL5984446.1 DNA-directed RNA polymerase, subunit E'' [Candidatus Thermoplasmatota archaeon]
MISLKACRQCHFISDQAKCPQCSGETSREWQGYVVLLDTEKSQIATKLGIKTAGRYALRVK